MQATVATFDVTSRDGTVLLDDGTRLEFDAAAFAASGLQHLRCGQRVRLDTDPDGRVVAVNIPTMP